MHINTRCWLKKTRCKTRLICLFRSMLSRISVLCNYCAVKGGKCVSILLNKWIVECWVVKLYIMWYTEINCVVIMLDNNYLTLQQWFRLSLLSIINEEIINGANKLMSAGICWICLNEVVHYFHIIYVLLVTELALL